jgi:hypothetical protein
MAFPAIGLPGHGSQDLERLDSLLAQPTVVQGRRAGGEIRVGQECLHYCSLPRIPAGYCTASCLVRWRECAPLHGTHGHRGAGGVASANRRLQQVCMSSSSGLSPWHRGGPLPGP